MYAAHDPLAEIGRWEDDGGTIDAPCTQEEAIAIDTPPATARPRLWLVKSTPIRPAPAS